MQLSKYGNECKVRERDGIEGGKNKTCARGSPRGMYYRECVRVVTKDEKVEITER